MTPLHWTFSSAGLLARANIILHHSWISVQEWACHNSHAKIDFICSFFTKAQKRVEVIHVKKILARNWPIGISLHCVKTLSWFVPTLSNLTYMTYINSYVLICKQSLAHLHLIYISDSKTLLLKQKEKEKCIWLGSNHKSVRNFMNSVYNSFQFTLQCALCTFFYP